MVGEDDEDDELEDELEEEDMDDIDDIPDRNSVSVFLLSTCPLVFILVLLFNLSCLIFNPSLDQSGLVFFAFNPHSRLCF